MRGGIKAALWLTLMAFLSMVGFFAYTQLTGDSDGVIVGLITGSMLLILAGISLIKLKLWK